MSSSFTQPVQRDHGVYSVQTDVTAPITLNVTSKRVPVYVPLGGVAGDVTRVSKHIVAVVVIV